MYSSINKIAIIHDALVVPAGSERVALDISGVLPDAPIYTSAYLPDNTFPEFKQKEIHTLPGSKVVKGEKQFKSLFPIWYWGFSSLDLSNYDLIISSANYLSKFINPPASSIHICYLHNPFRFLWKTSAYGNQSVPYGKVSQSIIRLFLPLFRKIDIAKTRKISHVITNSANTANQIKRIYDIQADVIYPPVAVSSYFISESIGDYYLYAGRLISHKRVDLAIKACNKLNRKLIIAGNGLERGNLDGIAGNSIEFLGQVSDMQLKTLYANCRALLFPSDEDFGLVPVEAQACGRPVIAYRSGGALETVIEGETGLFFDEQTPDSLIEAIQRFEAKFFDPIPINKNAWNFDTSVFRKKLLDYISYVIACREEI